MHFCAPITLLDPNSCTAPPCFLNYPFIDIGAMSGHLSFYLTVTFKGRQKDLQIFKVSVDSPPNVDVVVEPEVSDFSGGVKKASYRVNFYPSRYSVLVYGSVT
ncbi:hypothetical protein ACFX14_013855 [Malus domestica]